MGNEAKNYNMEDFVDTDSIMTGFHEPLKEVINNYPYTGNAGINCAHHLQHSLVHIAIMIYWENAKGDNASKVKLQAEDACRHLDYALHLSHYTSCFKSLEVKRSAKYPNKIDSSPKKNSLDKEFACVECLGEPHNHFTKLMLNASYDYFSTFYLRRMLSYCEHGEIDGLGTLFAFGKDKGLLKNRSSGQAVTSFPDLSNYYNIKSLKKRFPDSKKFSELIIEWAKLDMVFSLLWRRKNRTSTEELLRAVFYGDHNILQRTINSFKLFVLFNLLSCQHCSDQVYNYIQSSGKQEDVLLSRTYSAKNNDISNILKGKKDKTDSLIFKSLSSPVTNDVFQEVLPMFALTLKALGIESKYW